MESGTINPSSGTAASSDSSPEQDKAQDVAQEAREQAGSYVEQARSEARKQIDERSTQFGERASSLAGDLRTVGEKLRSEDVENGETGARVADQAAERAEQAGSYLAELDADRLLSDLEELGRRQPWLTLAGGVALGVVAGRLLKATSYTRFSQRSGSESTPTLKQGTPARTPAGTVGGTQGNGSAALDPASTPTQTVPAGSPGT